MKTELQDSSGRLYMSTVYDAANHWVYNTWIGEQSYLGVVAAAEACLALLKKHPCAYLISDNRQGIGTWDEVLEWVTHHWTPRAMAAGLTHFAQVVSVDSAAAYSSEMMRTNLEEKFQMRTFTVLAEAQAWLHKAQQTSGS
jgi:hypothetical protein